MTTASRKSTKLIGGWISNAVIFFSGYALAEWGWMWSVVIGVGALAFCFMLLGVFSFIEDRIAG